MGSKTPKKGKNAKRLIAGEKYHMLSFDNGKSTVMKGDLIKNNRIQKETRYVFSVPNNGFYRVFSEDEIRATKTGQAVRKSMKNGKMEFMAFFETKQEAVRGIDTLPKKVASLLIMESIERDKNLIIKIKGAVMDRISIFNDVVSSKTNPELMEAVKKIKDY